MAKGGGGGGDSTTNTAPWGPVQPALREGIRGAADLYRQGGLAAIGEESPWTLQARQGIADYATGGGSGLVPQAQGLAGATIGGDYLTGESNPYFQDAIRIAQEPVLEAWEERIMPRLDATFAGTAGGMGSGAYAAARERSARDIGRTLADAATTAGAQNYQTERGRQLQTMMGAPGLNMAGYGDLGMLGRVGAQEEARANLEAGLPGANVAEYMRLLQGGLNFGSSVTDQNRGGNVFTDYVAPAAGLGLTGLGLASGFGFL